jgi:glycerophosphoryl diester phosphodiesterase
MVIMHDLTVDRTTTGTGKVSELTFQEIKALDAGVKKDVKFRGPRVPTFQEVLDQMPANVWLNCHLKGEESEGSQAALLLLASGRIHQAFLTCSEKAAEGARKAVPNVKICNVEGRYRKDTPKYASETIRLKSDFIQLLRPAPGEQRDATIGLLRKHGVKINCFYADTPEEAATMWRSGIDFPLVNDFGAFLSVLNQEGIKPVTPLFDK